MLKWLSLSNNRLDGLTHDHSLFDNLQQVALQLGGQTLPPTPPPCPAEPEPEPPAPDELAARLAAAETRIAAQATRLDAHQATIEAPRAAIEGVAIERQRMDAKRRDADAAHDERLDAIEENIPPCRLRLWPPPPSTDE